MPRSELRPIERVRQRAARVGRTVRSHAQSDESSAFDRWSKRLAETSQIGVLVLGIFGYIYTVLPVYNRAKLEQQIEEKAAALEITKSELVDASKQLQASRDRLSLAEREARSFRQRSDIQYQEIRTRLAIDLESFGRGTCPIFPKGAASIPKCLNDLISSPSFDSWSPSDRKSALRNANAIVGLAQQLERDAQDRVSEKQAKLDADKAEHERNCGKGASAPQNNCISQSLKITFAADDLRVFQSREQWRVTAKLYESLRERMLASMR